MQWSSQLRGAGMLLAAAAAVGCADPSSYDQAVARLRECPAGDAPWRAAVRVAEEESRAAELTALASELSERCAGRWEPAWTVGRSLEGQSPDPDDVRRAFEESLRRAERLDDPVGLARCNNQLAWLAYTRGELDRAATTYRTALAAARRAERLDLESFIRNNLAGTLVDLGEFDDARGQLEAAARGLTELGREQAAQGLAFNRAVITLELGDARGALELLQSVHDWAVTHDDPWTVDASAVVAGNVHLGREDTASARSWYGRVGADHADLTLLAELGLARAALQDDDHATARRRLAALADRAGPTDLLIGALVQVVLADAELQGGDHHAARDRLRALVDSRETPIAADAAWAAWWLLGRCLERDGARRDALEAYERSVALLERQSGGLDPLSDGLYFLRHRADPYASLALALADESGPAAHDRIVEVMRTAQARALRAATAGVDLRAIRDSLADDEAIVVFLLGDDAGLAMTIRNDRTRTVPVAGRARLAGPLVEFATALRTPSGGATALETIGRSISTALLEPLREPLAGVRRVYVVPDRELTLIPFSALPALDGDRSATLGERFELAVLPFVGAPVRWTSAPTPVLLAGLPTSTSAAPLPWAGFELSRLQELWGAAGTTVTGEAFTLEAFVDLPLGGFGTVHLATHATASTVDPRRCGVTMSHDARMGIDRIVDLPLNDTLVVLSACSTGEGELVPGQGALSLGWAFMLAGARGVVASRWTVDDNASARLMVDFHRRMRDGVDPVRALSEARRELAARGAPPAHWAPFGIVVRSM